MLPLPRYTSSYTTRTLRDLSQKWRYDLTPHRPTCIFTGLSSALITKNSIPTPYAFEITYLAEKLDTVSCTGPLLIQPTKTFEDVREGRHHIDIMLIPGGAGARPWAASEGLKEFIKWGAENIEWVLTGEISLLGILSQYVWLMKTVCTGSWLLASTGALDGQKATTNKSAFKECQVSLVTTTTNVFKDR